MALNATREEPLEIVIDAAGKSNQYWKDLWRYRELVYFLCWRDVLVRYKQTVIGIAWAVLRPLLTIVVFTSFGAVFRIDTHGAERLLLVSIATLPWIL
jgi:lipopolysaccharide transport system permease protein